jgi:hypothetical protein
MNEDHFRGLVIAMAEDFGLHWRYQPDSRSTAGWKGYPDLTIAGPGGVLFVELKAMEKYPDECQVQWLDLLGGQCWHPDDLHSGLVKAELFRLAMS